MIDDRAVALQIDFKGQKRPTPVFGVHCDWMEFPSIFWQKGRLGLPTLDNAFAFQPYFKPAAHEDKVIRNTALQASGLRAARPHVLNH